MRISDWSSDGALPICLANRVVPKGQARQAAEALAAEIARFPQACMRADRASSYTQWHLSLDAALHDEAESGLPIIGEEAIDGAARFKGGLGRGGDFSSIYARCPIGRASCRERVCLYVYISGVAVSLKKKLNIKK